MCMLLTFFVLFENPHILTPSKSLESQILLAPPILVYYMQSLEHPTRENVFLLFFSNGGDEESLRMLSIQFKTLFSLQI
jgi:hypothetical protein